MHQVELMLLNSSLEHTPMNLTEDTTIFKPETKVLMRKMIEALLVMKILKLLPHHQNALLKELIQLILELLALDKEPLKEALHKEDQESKVMKLLLLLKPAILKPLPHHQNAQPQELTLPHPELLAEKLELLQED